MKAVRLLDASTHTADIDFREGVIININKPVDWTSFDVVKKIRKVVGIKRVGHAGTLDPFATGVLLVCIGPATKQVNRLMELQKEYVATLDFGKVTDTYDRTGTVLRETDPPNLSLAELRNACKRFVGQIEQTPPMYSAIRVDGRRLYELARRGEVVERPARKVHIHQLDLVDYQMPYLKIRVVCSRGTYIRSLAHDLGEVVGCGAYLQDLVRTRIGPHTLEKALSIESLEALVN